MSAEFRLIEEADGKLILEIETDQMELNLELDEADADTLLKDLSSVMQDRYYERYGNE
jgi:hypothetical protein